MAKTPVHVILKILTIEPDGRVATVTKLGVQTYLAHPDKLVRDAIRAYLTHNQRKPIAQINEPAHV